ncbi:MAG TPA: GNAT family N-acetyltransferase [Chthoniobacter sp.]|jgi:ribosomal protein S18 acetylase RimI-like enzyme
MPTLAPPTASLVIRPAGVDEIPALRALAERIWRVSYAIMLSPAQIDYMLSWMYAPETIAREMAEGVLWEGAWLDGEFVGFHSCTPEPAAHRLKLNKVYLLPEYQGQGLGQQLLDRVHLLAARCHARQVWLQVNKQNARAISAYCRSGYVVERSAVFDIGGGFVMDDFIMTRDVDAIGAPVT